MIKKYLNQIQELRRETTSNEIEDLIRYLDDYFQGLPPIKLLEETIKHYKAIDQSIISQGLLEDLDDMEIDTFENDNIKAKIKLSVSASIKDKERGYRWLEDFGYGDLLKDTLAFPKGELNKESVDFMEKQGLSYVRKTSIHSASLKKIMKDRFEAGEELPEEDLIKVSHFSFVEIKEKTK
jgi:hypothetical protein